MPTGLDNMLAAAGGILDGYHGLAVTLKKGKEQSDAFTATLDNQEYETVSQETGLPVKIVSTDFYLPAADLVIGGETIEPAAGMVIVEGSAQYEILPVAGRPAAELQPGGDRWLVHTKKVQ